MLSLSTPQARPQRSILPLMALSRPPPCCMPPTAWHSWSVASSYTREASPPAPSRLSLTLRGSRTPRSRCPRCPGPRGGSRHPSACWSPTSPAMPSRPRQSQHVAGSLVPPRTSDAMVPESSPRRRCVCCASLPLLMAARRGRRPAPGRLQTHQSSLCPGDLWGRWANSRTTPPPPPTALRLRSGWRCGWRSARLSGQCNLSGRLPGRTEANCRQAAALERVDRCCWPNSSASQTSRGWLQAASRSLSKTQRWSSGGRTRWTRASPTPMNRRHKRLSTSHYMRQVVKTQGRSESNTFSNV